MNTTLEWIGYLASVIIAISMAFSSVTRFRWANLVGAFLFSTYGFLIGALPVAFLNGFIVCVDIYYLYRIYSQKEHFEILETDIRNTYVDKFIEFYKKDIHKYFPEFNLYKDDEAICYLILRNVSPTGLFIAKTNISKKTLRVELDYVIPEYRDLKNGQFIYQQIGRNILSNVQLIEAKTFGKKHQKYLKRLGFSEQNGMFIKHVQSNGQ